MTEYICKICDYQTTKRGNYNRHLKTKKHKQKIEISENVFECSLCNYVTLDRNDYLKHMRSTIHDEEDTNKIFKKKITENIENDIKTVFDIDSKNIETEKLINLQNSLNKILEEQENIKKMIPKSGGNTIINNKLSILNVKKQ